MTEGGPGLVGIDLYGSRLAYVWELIGPECREEIGADQLKEDPITSELWLGSIRGDHRRIGLGCSTDRTQFFQSPSFASGRLSYIAAGPGIAADPPRTLRVIRLSSGARSDSNVPSCLSALVAATDALYMARETTCPHPAFGEPAEFEISRTPFSLPPG